MASVLQVDGSTAAARVAPPLHSVTLDLMHAHEMRRQETINLVASENLMSPAARLALASDFAHRYCLPPPGERPEEIWDYPNQAYSRNIEKHAKQVAMELFHGGFADVRPLSGNNIAGILLASLAKPRDHVISVPAAMGGHFSTVPLCKLNGLVHHELPYDSRVGRVDLAACAALAETVHPRLIYLDASMLLFPYPVRELREIFGRSCVIAYDASHCFGIIAGACFQAPLIEGADLIVGSTHKSMFGPQKGLIVARRNDATAAAVSNAITPLFVSNSHVHHIAALAITLEELAQFGQAYATQVVANAQALGAALTDAGVNVLFPEQNFTECHQLLCTLEVTDVVSVLSNLERVGIHVNGVHVPFTRKRGLRLGAAELTRRGFMEDDMRRVARLLTDALFRRAPESLIAEAVRELSRSHPGLRYGFSEDGLPLDAAFPHQN